MTPSFPLSLPRAEGPVFVLDSATLQRGIAASRQSPRGRIVLPVHRSATEGVQRMLNFMQPGSYARPHRHPEPECIETVVAVNGAAGFLIFGDDGKVLAAHRLAAGEPASCLIDVEQGIWHTVVPLAEDTVILEIKRGPYNAVTDKIFAPWAPAEGDPGAADYLGEMAALFAR